MNNNLKEDVWNNSVRTGQARTGGISTDVFASSKGIDPTTLKNRIDTIGDLINLCDDAIKEATAKGNTSMINALQKRKQELTDYLNNTNQTGQAPEDSEQSGSKTTGSDDAKAKNAQGSNDDKNDESDSQESDENSEEKGKEGKDSKSGKEDQDQKSGEDGKDSKSGADDKKSGEADKKDSYGNSNVGSSLSSHSQNNNSSNSEHNSSSDDSQTQGSKEGASKDEKDTSEEGDEEGAGSKNQDSEESEDGDGKNNKQNNQNQKSNSNSSDDQGGGESDPNEEDEDDPTKPPPVKNNKVLINPFKDNNINVQMPPSMKQAINNGQLEIEDELDAIKRILKKLTGDNKKGAQDALRDIMKSHGKTMKESLTEVLHQGIRNLTDDEYGDLVNSTYDLIKKSLGGFDTQNPIDVETRIKKIHDDAEDEVSKHGLKQELQKIQSERKPKTTSAAKAKQDEITRYSKNTNLYNMNSFASVFLRAIKQQVEEYEREESSWAYLNRQFEDEDDILEPGTTEETVPAPVPTVNIYFDQSGSWDESDILQGNTALSGCAQWVKEGKLKVNVLYFSDTVHTVPRRNPDGSLNWGEGGTNAWSLILDDIQNSKAKNVVIMTDGDMDGDARYSGKLIVQGYVWWIWKNGETAPECAKHLIGQRGGAQFAF